MKLRWTEVFYSIQGEGLRVGKPSVFIRMFGCNLKCQGFGMEDGILSNEYLDVDVKKYKTLKDLPIVRTGCDSYASWDPRCKHLTSMGDVDKLMREVAMVIYNATGSNSLKGIDVVITGGEPLLGWQKAYPELIDALSDQDCTTVTFETNGTKPLIDHFEKYLPRQKVQVIWSISPKLSASGESQSDTIKPEAVKSLVASWKSRAYFKFVVDPKNDVSDVKWALEIYKEAGIDIPVYLMPAGGRFKEYQANAQSVAKMCLDNRWGYSPRLHVDLFGNEWGT